MQEQAKTSNSSVEELRNRLQTVAQQTEADGKHFVGIFVHLLLSKEQTDEELLRCFYKCDFLESLTEESVFFAANFLRRNAPADWYMLMQSAYEEKPEPERFCEILTFCFDHGLDAVKVRPAFEESTTADTFYEFLISHSGDSTADDDDNKIISNANNQTDGIEKKEDPIVARNLEGIVSEQKTLISQLQTYNTDVTGQLLRTREDLERAIISGKINAAKVFQYADRMDAMEESIRQLTEENRQLISGREDTIDPGTVEHLREERQSLEKQLAEREAEVRQLQENVLSWENRMGELEETFQKEKKRLIEDLTMPVSESGGDFAGGNNHMENDGAGEDDFAAFSREYQAQWEGEEGMGYDDSLLNDLDTENMARYSTGSEESMEQGFGGVIEITDGREQIEKKTSIFARLFARYHERAFAKKPENEQKNLLFIKMMDMRFSKEKTKIVRAAMEQGSRMELYKMVARDASAEELEQYSKSLMLAGQKAVV